MSVSFSLPSGPNGRISDNGIFFAFNLETLDVSRILETGGAPVQGSLINWDDFYYGGDSHSSGM